MIGIAGYCYVSEMPAFTRNLFGPVSKIAGQRLKVIDRNTRGDCLALLPDESGLVDVHTMDVVTFQPAPPEPFSTAWMDNLAAMLRASA